MLNRKISFTNISALVLILLFAFLLIRYQIKILHFYEWADESTEVVTAKMMAQGYRLYTEVHNNHGPLIFLPGLLLEKIASFGIAGHRVVTLLMQLALLAAIYFSPIVKRTAVVAKLSYIAIAATILVGYFPILAFAQMYTYQVFAGIFTAIVLAQYALPQASGDAPISRKTIIVCNALIVSLPFLAITYAPTTILLLLACFKKEQLRDQVYGIALGLGLNALFILLFASFPGWYAIHYYVSMKVMLGLQAKDTSLVAFLVEAYKGISLELHTFLMFVAVSMSAAKLANFQKGIPYRAILILVAVLSFLIRGTGFQAVGFYYAFLVMPIIFLRDCNAVNTKTKGFLLFVLTLCCTKLSAQVGIDKFRLEERKIAQSSQLSDLIKKITDKNDRVLIYTFRSSEYILSDRLPASGNHHYFPWQAKFYENPLYGISIDTCKDIERIQPKIISTDFWTPIDSMPWLSYTQCIQDALKMNYSQVKNSNIWIRNDVFPAELQKH